MTEIRNYMISILLFAAVIIAMTGFMGGLITGTQSVNPSGCTWCANLTQYDYGNFSETRLNNTIQRITTETEHIRGNSTDSDFPIIGDIVSIVTAGIDGLLVVYDSLDLTFSMIGDMSHVLRIPYPWSSVFTTIILIILVFTVIYVFTGRRV